LSAPDDTPAVPDVLKRSAVPKVIVAVCIAALALIALLFFGTRYGVLLPQARVLIEARADGLKIGRFGKLKIEGLSGDIWRDFSIRRLTVRDEQGVWLDAANVHMRWRYGDLLRRRFTADSIEAQSIRLIRRPTLTAKGKDTGLPVSFQIGKAHARVELLEGFSYRHGVYDLDLALDVERAGGQRGQVRAASVLHPGDHLNLDFDIAPTRPLVLLADAEEAQGGALAGALGLPADRPFVLKVAAGGKTSEGRFTALATSGALVPLSAQGAWNPAGGEARGRILLTASTLTRGWARRIGDRAVFGIAGRKAGPDDFALSARVYGDNLALRADGLGDIGQRTIGPKGLALVASTPNLSRITGGPDMGATRVAGVLTKSALGWKFAGSGAAQKLQLGSYGLAEASGPVQVSTEAGAVSVTARLAGRGGQGAGWIAAVMGSAPTASFEGSRLADGRLALKRLDVAGAGLKVQASGGRGLLGGLTFKGRADLSNLAAARSGAAGAATATWSASQSGAEKPWVFTLDARGDRFATGYAELDRLLGPKPRVALQASYKDSRVAVAKGALDGAAFNATTAGVLAADGGLSFKIDWTAQGPFSAGPVEIAGKARGNGALTGKLAEPRLDLIADVDQVDVPRLPLKAAHITLSFLRKADGSSGMVAATAVSPQGPARARADFRFPEGGVDLTGLSVDAGGLTAQGSVSLRRGAPSAADLQVAVVRGAFLDDGRVTGRVRIVDAPGGARATIDLNGVNARLPGTTLVLSRVRLNADGPLARLPYGAQAAGTSGGETWSFAGHGAVTETKPGYAATFEGDARLGARDLHTVETATFRFGGPERSARLRLAGSDGGRIDLDGRLAGDAADLKLTVAKLTLGLLQQDMTGQVDGTLSLQGRGATLAGALDARLTDARGRGAPASSAIDGTVKGRLADQALALDAVATNDQGLKANANLVLPTEASAAPLHLAIARQRPMQGRFAAEGEVAPLWDLLIGGERSLAGFVRTQGTLGGTLADPTASGQVTVERGRFDDGATGLSLRNVAVAASFDRDTVDVTQARGDDGHGGSVDGAGRISLEREGVSGFRLNLKGFRLIDNEQATASATGQATIRRAATGKVTLAGALTIDRADVAADLPTPSGVVPMEVKEINRPASLAASLPAAEKRGEGWALDVKLEAPRRVYLRGRGLDVELSLDAHVGGTSSHPQLSGVARVVRGDYDFAGKRFEFDTRSVVYLASDPEDIRLDLIATREDPTLTAEARIRGTADKPEFSLTSTPSLPSDEILSEVLFGRSASQLSPLEAAQLASALASLSHGGGFDVIGNLRTFAGLDRLAFAGGGEGGVSVAGGKYLTDDVYLELIGGSKDGPAAQVEWRIKRNLSILSRITGQGGSKLSVRWRKDY
jgi:translocation and assembly module TamB